MAVERAQAYIGMVDACAFVALSKLSEAPAKTPPVSGADWFGGEGEAR
jgi:hypothetical protein